MTTMTLTTVMLVAFCAAAAFFAVISAVLRLEARLRHVESSVADAMQRVREDAMAERRARREADARAQAAAKASAPFRSCGCGCHGVQR